MVGLFESKPAGSGSLTRNVAQRVVVGTTARPSPWPAPDEHFMAARLYLGVNERYAAGLKADLGH